MKTFAFAAVFLPLFFLCPARGQAQSPSEIEIIFDASGSMNDPMGGGTKLDAAKQVLTSVAGQIQEGAHVGLRFFGTSPIQGNIRESCTDSVLAMPIAPFLKDSMVRTVQPIRSYGMTALGFSLQQAAGDFSRDPAAQKTIILISDGEETCGQDPVAVVNDLKAQGINFQIHAVGFDASDAAKTQLKSLAEATGGSYLEAKDANELQASLQQVAEKSKLLTIQRGGGDNMLAAAAGTTIVSTSNQDLAKMIDGKEEETGFTTDQEVVFAFKQPVLLEKFALPIFQTAGWNLADLTLMGSTDKADTGYFPVAQVKTQNTVLFGNVYQETKIDPPQPLRYLKVIVGKRFDGGTGPYSFEWKAYGKYLTDEEFQEALKNLPAHELNLLAVENGGQFIAGAKTDFANWIDGKSGQSGAKADAETGAEGIFGFAGGKAVTLSSVAVPVFEQSQYNCKKIEVSVSLDSPTGPYTAAGVLETMNMVFAGNPYQALKFSQPVKAKYLKIKILETWGMSYCTLAEVQAFGQQEG